MLKELFKSEESMNQFKERYFEAFNKERLYEDDIKYINWDSVADDIYLAFQNYNLTVGDLVDIELGQYYSKTGNPVMIHVGEIVEIPVPDPEHLDDPAYNDGDVFLGDFVGDYRFA